MASLQATMIETIFRDLSALEGVSDPKTIRKECALLLERVESARKLVAQDQVLMSQLDRAQQAISQLKTARG